MKRLLIFLLLAPFFGFAQVQTDANLTSQINSTIRGKLFNAKSHADMFKTVVDSKLNTTYNFNSAHMNFSNVNEITVARSSHMWIRGTSAGSLNFKAATGQSIDFGFGLTGGSVTITSNELGTPSVFVNQIRGNVTNGGNITSTNYILGATATQTATNKTFGSGTVFSSAPTINDGLKFTFNPNGTNAGLNFGAHTANPSSPVNGDAYYNSTTNQLFAYINGAWVSLGSGGGFTNGAANNELIKSNGTNGVSSGIFAEVLAGGLTTTFGTGSTAGNFRDFIAAGSEANIAFRFIPKGSGNVIFQSTQQITSSAPVTTVTNSGYTLELRPSDRIIRFSKTSTGAKQNLIQGGAGISSENDADSLVIAAGDAYGVSGNGNGGNLILKPGEGNGTGVDGIVYAKHQGYNISLTLFQPVQETGTSFTFDYSHLSKLVVGNNAATQTATVPALQVGYITKVVQDGAGVMNLSAGANVVLVGKTSTTGVGDTIVIHAYKTSGSDTYYLCE